ncbi:MAG: hypothetical protein K2X11_04805, partial [Acetobacteraceae bacterium]|nr:hypothetical protein [Acetobacteraceae bacterium]
LAARPARETLPPVASPAAPVVVAQAAPVRPAMHMQPVEPMAGGSLLGGSRMSLPPPVPPTPR